MSTENAIYHALASKGPATVKQLAKASKLEPEELEAGLADFKNRQWADEDVDEDDPEKSTWTLNSYGAAELAQRYADA